MQIIWSRYLSHLIGADALAQALCVGTFLLGLSLGYYSWGRWSQNLKYSFTATYYYILCEFLIALWCLLFPFIYEYAQKIHSLWPSTILSDFLSSNLLILFPAFLMGGTIPLLTTSLPSSLKKVNKVHARIYGFNTLGAGLGAILGGMVFLQFGGLSFTLQSVGFINLCLCFSMLIFVKYFSKYSVNIDRLDLVKEVNSENFALPRPTLYAASFFTGLWIISIEIVCFRFFSLSLGSSVYIYPMVVGIFVVGLGLGALTLKESNKNSQHNRSLLQRELGIASTFFAFSIFLLPYLNYWVNILNNKLSPLKWGYEGSFVVQFLLYGSILIPVLFFSGRILPRLYSLYPKNINNYSKVCGKFYFYNTVGSLLGSIGMGYFAYKWFSLEIILKALIILGLIFYAYFIGLKKNETTLMGVCVLLIIVLLTPLNRSGDVINLFSVKDYVSLFQIPKHPSELVFLEDNTLATISILKHPAARDVIPPIFDEDYYYSIHLNGKNEGGTFPDLLTMSLIGILPYVYSTGEDLSIAIVGLGTGVTAGILAQLEHVKEINVIEISEGLIKASERISHQNLNAVNHPKVKIIKQDALSYFHQNKKHYDIIISEPSGNWTLGSENLYSLDFYMKIKKALKPKGIFVNWLHLYNNDKEDTFLALRTVFKVFPYVRSYLLSGGVDMGMLITDYPLNSSPFAHRFNDPLITKLLPYYGFEEAPFIEFNQLFNWNRADFTLIDPFKDQRIHRLDSPLLAYRGYKNRFLKSSYNFLRDPQILNTKKSNNHWALFSDGRSRVLTAEFISEKQSFLKYCNKPKGKLVNPICSFISYLYDQYWLPASKNNHLAINGLVRFGVLQSSEDFPVLKSSRQ
ncbi:MAG: hypothetical protein KDD58_08300 [Bdellovibrionales bacterium]|nr:hypothetical protein [Bdellovibrionales bacterium]